jgi:peptidoglycan hydrolase CwlO-like protein
MSFLVRSLLIGFSVFSLIAGASIALTPTVAYALTEEEKAKLRVEYDKLQQEILEWQKVLDDTRAKKNTIQGDVTALNAQIKKAETEIKQRNNTITTLAAEINEKTTRIGMLE